MVFAAKPSFSDDSEKLLTIDHFVRVRSTAPSMASQLAQIYVRERVQAGSALRGRPAADRVALFIHGAGTPAEVAFDVPYQDYSWMGYLARAGFDVFSADMTGYGRSTRPTPMNDPCTTLPPCPALGLVKPPWAKAVAAARAVKPATNTIIRDCVLNIHLSEKTVSRDELASRRHPTTGPSRLQEKVSSRAI